ncbi:MAG: Uma2 family endonuclease, partial [Pseudanabaena sp. ELA748]
MAEVLSNSTKNYDRGEKFADYRTISSFQEYLLIDQPKPHAEHYIKQSENQWLFSKLPSTDLSTGTVWAFNSPEMIC